MMNNMDPDSTIIKSRHGLVSIYDYGKIDLMPCMEFTKIESVIPYLKDKTTAVCRTETLYKVLGVPADDIDVMCSHDIDMSKPKYNRDNIRDVIHDLKIKYQIYDKSDYVFDDQDKEELSEYEDYIQSPEYKTNIKLYKEALKKVRDDINKTRVSWSNTRLILSYLCSPDILHDYTKMINRAVTSRDFSLYADYLVSKIVPKEKELKIKYRGYGCLTPLPRHKNLIQEKNTKKFMEEYCDEQASTLSELSLIKKLYALRNLKEAYQGFKYLCINVDASGWNKRFRSQTVNPIMENSLDRIFNYPIFTTTHEM